MDSTEFIWGTFDTGFISRRRMEKSPLQRPEHEKIVAVVAAMIAHEESKQAVHIGGGQQGNNGSRANLWKQAGRTRAVGGRR